MFLCAECASNPKGSEDGVTIPEDLGKKASYLLLEEIYRVSDPVPKKTRNHRKCLGISSREITINIQEGCHSTRKKHVKSLITVFKIKSTHTTRSFLCICCKHHPPAGSNILTALKKFITCEFPIILINSCDLFLQGGCVDSTSQGLACVMMTLGDQDVSKLQTGPLSPYT